MILYLLLVLRKINWMFLPQVEHCGETKTEMRGMVSAEIYHWALTKKQLFTSFFWKAWLDYLITFTRRLAKQRLQFLFSFFFLSRHQGKTAKWFNLNFNTIDYWFYPEPVNEKDLKSNRCLSDMIWRQHWPRPLACRIDFWPFVSQAGPWEDVVLPPPLLEWKTMADFFPWGLLILRWSPTSAT